MKRVIIIVLLSFWYNSKSFSQDNFYWETTVDTIHKSKQKLYSDIKLWIGKTYREPARVIKDDDFEGNVILISGIEEVERHYHMANPHWYFRYSLKIQFKDNKVKITISDVYCDDVIPVLWAKMPVSEHYPTENGLKITGVYEDRYKDVMGSLKLQLQLLHDNFLKTITIPAVTKSDEDDGF